MNNKIKAIILISVFAFLILSVPVCLAVLPKSEYSAGERRMLSEFPQVTYEKIMDGSFMEDFEKYTQDHFPLRDGLREMKAKISYNLLAKKDNNGIYMTDGHISKLDGELNYAMLCHAAERMTDMYEAFMRDKNANVYFSIVPDKNMFLAKKNGYLSLDYEKLSEFMSEKTDFAEYIDIMPLLSADDYYKTDSHWKQENITDVAEYIGKCMGVDVSAEYTINSLDNPFYGVYYGQSALSDFGSDEIRYLTGETLNNAEVTYYDSGMPEKGELYNMEKAYGKDPYEMFLSGSTPLAVIENPGSSLERELIIIRDSFGSSLAPLMLEGYSKITVADTRYMQPAAMGSLVDFSDADVLFIYSSSLLNNSLAIK